MATTTQIRTSTKVRGRTFSLAKLLDWAAILALGAGAIIMILPFLWMFSTSLRPSAESYKLPPAWLPTDWRFENYTAVFTSSVPIVAFALNSIKVTFFVTLGQLITCSMAGFAFARLRFPGRNLLFILLLASLMVPGQVTIIPIFIIMRRLGLVDNHLALILPGLTSAFGVFMMRQYTSSAVSRAATLNAATTAMPHDPPTSRPSSRASRRVMRNESRSLTATISSATVGS